MCEPASMLPMICGGDDVRKTGSTCRKPRSVQDSMGILASAGPNLSLSEVKLLTDEHNDTYLSQAVDPPDYRPLITGMPNLEASSQQGFWGSTGVRVLGLGV